MEKTVKTPYKYVNMTKQELVLIGHGVIKPNEQIESDEPIHNPNLKLVGNKVLKGDQK